MTSQNPKDWKDWQRVLYVWRYRRGRSGLTLNLLAHVCGRSANTILAEMKKVPAVGWFRCEYMQVTVFQWLPLVHAAFSSSRRRIARREHHALRQDLKRWPPTKFISVYRGVGERGPKLQGRLGVRVLRAIAQGKRPIQVKPQGVHYVWV